MTESTTHAGRAARQWHITRWPPLAWLETLIKLIALVFAVALLAGALDGDGFDLPRRAGLAQLVVLAVLSLGLVAAIGDRLIEREITAMIFVIANNLGHWSMVFALLLGDAGHGIALFAALMLAGDLVKLLFLAAHTDFTVRDVPRIVLYALTAMYAAGYALILLLEMVK